MMASDTKQKKKNFKAVRPKLRLFRAKEPVLSVFMWGINHTINELQHISVPVMLMPDDFKAYSKTRIDNHNYNKENMPSHFKFKEYCPLVFRDLRERFGISDEDYMESLTRCQPTESGESSFYESCDRKFIVRKINADDVAEFMRIAKDYHQFVVERYGQTLLPHFLGMYRITVNDNETYMVVMKNIFSPRLTVHKKYDLKGSTVQREASDKEKAKDLPTYKDNDFLNEKMTIQVGDSTKQKLMENIQADAQFLVTQKLMDYSLLVGVHDLDRADQEQLIAEENAAVEENGGGTESEDEVLTPPAQACATPTPPESPIGRFCNHPPSFTGELDTAFEKFAVKCSDDCPRREIYFLALIDILTHYGMKKRSAQAAKTVKYGAGAEISTVKPEQYARRLIEFIDKIIV